MEEDQRRQEAARQETARQEAARQEALRQEALRLQHEEQKRQDALRQQQDEQKRLAALQQQQEEQKRQEALRQQQEEQKRLAALQQQQEEQKRQDALRQQADTERRRIEETCRREEAKLAELQLLGASAREQLVKLEIEAGCKALRPLITAAIAALPADIPPVKPVPVTPPAGPTPALQPAKANLPEQIRQAQTKLRQLGCFGGAPDGKMNEATRNAVKAFWSHTHKPIVEINITDEFIADLEQHHDRICAPPPVKRDPVPVATHQRPPRSEPAPPREASRPAPATRAGP